MKITDVRVRKITKEGKMKAIVSIFHCNAQQKGHRWRIPGHCSSDQSDDEGKYPEHHSGEI